jgi:hypothetical protein
MIAPIEIIRLRAYEGPNVFGPAPGVLLHARGDRDRSARVRAAIKDGAQFMGLVIGQLSVEAQPDSHGVIISALFGCEAPALGAALCAYVVAGVTAEATGDEEWDRDGPLFALQARRRAGTLPVAAIQLIAEARRRGLPSFSRADGRVQLGYGARGWSYDPAALTGEGKDVPAPPWAELGAIPIVAVTGALGRAAAVRRMAAELARTGLRVRAVEDASFETARVALADPEAEALVLGLESNDILRRGLPCDRCELAIITDRAGPRPAEAADDEEWVRALGIPMLLSPQAARLSLSDAGLLPLVPYAPNGVVDWPATEQ